MELDFKMARWQQDEAGVWLCLLAANNRQAREFCAGMKPDKLYTAKLGAKRNKRSLDANAYFWALADKAAVELSKDGPTVSPEDVYRSLIPHVGGNSKILPIRAEAVEDWERVWCAGRTGWITEDMGECKTLEGYRNIRCYYGSSVYDTAQMSRLIDLMVQECKQLDIETLPLDRLAAMLEEWGSEKQTDKSTGYQPSGEGSGS